MTRAGYSFLIISAYVYEIILLHTFKSNRFWLPVLPSVSSVSLGLVFRRTDIHLRMVVRSYKNLTQIYEF